MKSIQIWSCFFSVFSCDLLCKSTHSVKKKKNTEQENYKSVIASSFQRYSAAVITGYKGAKLITIFQSKYCYLASDWLLTERPRRFHKRSRDIGSVRQPKCNQTWRRHFERLVQICWWIDPPNIFDLLLRVLDNFWTVVHDQERWCKCKWGGFFLW